MKLEDPVSMLPGVGLGYLTKLQRLGIKTIEDLLYHLPVRHIDFTNKVQIKDLSVGENVTVSGQVVSIQNIFAKSGKVLQIAKISDGEATAEAIWVNQPYLTRVLREGTFITLSGKYSFWGKKRAFVFPQFEKLTDTSSDTGKLLPIYPETSGVSSKWLGARVRQALSAIEPEDFMGSDTLAEHGLAPLSEALWAVHGAKTREEFSSGYRRLAFDELLMLQIKNHLKKLEWRKNNTAHSLLVKNRDLREFLDRLPFSLTESQERAVSELTSDLKRDVPMNRLLEGDVGSGKTVVAAAGGFLTFTNAKKAVFMAPTQILAQQHFETLRSLLAPFNTRLALVTSSGITSSLGSIDIVVGTHSLLYREEFVREAAFLVIDEQHRFGVKQRAKIAQIATSGGKTPHVLTMTATPIPRTIALTLYGDLDVSSLDQLPEGRKKIKTWVVPPQKRASGEKWIAEQIEKGGAQVFVVCPIIEESAAETMQSVKAATREFERLKQVFSRQRIALLHGRMKASEKNKVIADFKNKKYDILVSTPVIEVGIDIPNATIIVIEAAERFGLASIHQLRGRVGRGDKQAYCLLFSETKSKKAKERLLAAAKAESGRALSELDLETRGPGEILGIAQSGLPELRIAKWNDIELIKKTRSFAEEIVQNQEKYQKTLEHYRKKQAAPN